jgi:hypothetical protein
MQYDQHCAGCQRAQGLHSIPGGVIGLPGDWSVSHYAGGEGFLGWLALQPRFHRDRLQDLTKEELLALGPNLRALDFGLTEYWKLQFLTTYCSECTWCISSKQPSKRPHRRSGFTFTFTSSRVQEPSANSSSARAVARPGWMAGKRRGLRRVERSRSDTVRSRQCGPNESHNSWSTYGMSCHSRLRLPSVRTV